MASSPSLQQLKNRHLVWHARDSQKQHGSEHHSDVSSGSLLNSQYPLLDQKLGGGWPDKGVIELNTAQPGCGELRLILPALKHCQDRQQKRLLAWVNPPARLNPLALAQVDIDLDKVMIATPPQNKDSYWVVEQLLRSACCSAIVFWCDALEARQAKRLQIQAKQNQTLLFIIRYDTQQQVQQSLPLSMRMHVQAEAHGLRIDIFKRQNQWPIAPFSLDMQSQWSALYPHSDIAQEQAMAEATAPSDNVVPFPFAHSRADQAAT